MTPVSLQRGFFLGVESGRHLRAAGLSVPLEVRERPECPECPGSLVGLECRECPAWQEFQVLRGLEQLAKQAHLGQMVGTGGTGSQAPRGDLPREAEAEVEEAGSFLSSRTSPPGQSSIWKA